LADSATAQTALLAGFLYKSIELAYTQNRVTHVEYAFFNFGKSGCANMTPLFHSAFKGTAGIGKYRISVEFGRRMQTALFYGIFPTGF